MSGDNTTSWESSVQNKPKQPSSAFFEGLIQLFEIHYESREWDQEIVFSHRVQIGLMNLVADSLITFSDQLISTTDVTPLYDASNALGEFTHMMNMLLNIHERGTVKNFSPFFERNGWPDKETVSLLKQIQENDAEAKTFIMTEDSLKALLDALDMQPDLKGRLTIHVEDDEGVHPRSLYELLEESLDYAEWISRVYAEHVPQPFDPEPTIAPHM